MPEFVWDIDCDADAWEPRDDVPDPPDPVVSAAIVAAAILALACAVFLVSGLPARVRERLAPSPAAHTLRVAPAHSPRSYF